MSKLFNVAVVGATGVVGRQVLEILTERNFPVGKLLPLVSERSDGEFVDFADDSMMVQTLAEDSFAGIDLAFFCVPAQLGAKFCPLAVRAGAVCIDSSSAWRLDVQVPLVAPEVNPQELARYRTKGIIAMPGAASVALAVALKPLHELSPIRRLVVISLQAVSGNGQPGIDELRTQCGELLNGRPCDAKVYPHQIAFNCLPQVGAFLDNGDTGEELSMIHEIRRLLAVDDLPMTVTAVQAPVFYGHSAAVNMETERAISVSRAREALGKEPGVELVDEPAESSYPTPVDAVGSDQVLVGRLRADESRARVLNLWLSADNLRIGAAVGAVRIAEILAEKYL